METRTKTAKAAGWAFYVLGVVVLDVILLALVGNDMAQLTLVASTLLFAALLRPLRWWLSDSIEGHLKGRLALRAARGDRGLPRR
jgi:cell division protein FtsW (lipid II flippase)